VDEFTVLVDEVVRAALGLDALEYDGPLLAAPGPCWACGVADCTCWDDALGQGYSAEWLGIPAKE